MQPRSNLSYEERTFRKGRPANRAICYGNYAKSILMRIKIDRNSSVLEFGCGPGTNLLKLEASSPRNVAFVDKDPECIREAIDRFQRRVATTRLAKCSFHCIDFTGQGAATEFIEKNVKFNTILAFYSLQYIGASPEIANLFFENCAAVSAPNASILGIFPNAQRLCAAAGAQSLFTVEQSVAELVPRTGIPYTFQISGQKAYREYTLCAEDLYAAARNTFVLTAHCSVLEFLAQSEKKHPALCASLFKCIVERNCTTALSLEEQQLIDLYDIVIFTKIKN